MRRLLIVLGSGLGCAAGFITWLYFDTRSATDPTWFDGFAWGVILMGPMAFSFGVAVSATIVAAVAFAEYVINNCPSGGGR